MNELGIDPSWIKFGIIGIDQLANLLEAFNSSEDKNTEHYRWKVFKEYSEGNQCLPPEKILKLFSIIQLDADLVLRAAMIIEVIKRSDATIDLLILTSKYDNSSVKKKAQTLMRSHNEIKLR